MTATDAADGLLAVANRGAHLAVAAPGVDVLAPAPGDGFAYMSGTSMASAEIAGVAALMLEAKPGLDTAEVRSALAASARDLGRPGPDAEFGAGGADAKGALDAIAAPATASVAPAATPVSANAVDLVYYHEKSVEEASEILGVPAATVKTRMFYARKKLSELLAAAGIERGWP